ncbi:MAG: hypothetical protein HYV32_04145 [Candidatus Kerfeldbacteria bacterium]|nr:hypothetical protein [Candidatus Kerfeldbacteria bacterium]
MNRERLPSMIAAWPKQWNAIQELVRSGTMHHGYVITGSTDAPLHLFLEAWSAFVLCTKRITSTEGDQQCGQCLSCVQFNKHLHPDLLIVQPEPGTVFGVDSAQRVREHLLFSPMLSTKRIAIIYDAHVLSTTAVNALLKIIEEPPASAMILLSTTHLEQLPATLRSRVHTMYLPPSNAVDEEEKTLECKDFFLANIVQRQQMVQQLFSQESDSSLDSTQLAQVIRQMETFMRNLLLVQYGVESATNQKWNAQELHQLAQQYHGEEIQHWLERLHQCQEMLSQKVNKKMILDYLITSL